MIYFDNGATTLRKPPEVAEAVKYAIDHFGNAGRSFYDAAMSASRALYDTRRELAELVGLDDPLSVAFTSSSTESLNLVIGGLIGPEDAVITSVAEHNSVLRPLYLSGCRLDFMDCDDGGVADIDGLSRLITPKTRFLVCTHGSNVTGNIIDARALYRRCREYGVTLILDVSQTLGEIPVDTDMADILCFTGHKGLFGPQGTGGIIANGRFPFRIVKTGGAGSDSFARIQSDEMPEVFEVGTLNSHGIYGLQKGVQFVKRIGVDAIHRQDARLTEMFVSGVRGLRGIRLYGDFDAEDRLPIVSLGLSGMSAADLAAGLWERFGIAARAGAHCAPLLHERFGTRESGMVRFSFSYFNTEDEVRQGIAALTSITEER